MPRLFGLIMLVVVLTPSLSACGDAAEDTTSSSFETPAQATPSGLTGDIDGDGVDDVVTIVGPKTADRRHALVVDTGGTELRFAFPAKGSLGSFRPVLDGLADIDPTPGLEIVADVHHGASTGFAAVFTIRRDELVRLDAEGQLAYLGGTAFAYGGSVGHVDGVDCLKPGSGRIVAGGVGNNYPRPWRGERRTYEVRGREFLLQRVREIVVPSSVDPGVRLPELDEAPFPSCTEVTPAAG